MKTILVLSAIAVFATQPSQAQVIPAPLPPGYASPQVVYVNAPSNGGISGAAQQQQQQLSSAATMNMMMGVMLLTMCSQAKPPNMLICMMGMMALMQGLQLQQNANSAATALAQSSTPNTLIQYIPVGIPQGPGVTGGLNALTTAGYQVSSTGVTVPNGTVVPITALGTPSGFSSLGFSPSTQTQAQQAWTQVSQQIHAQQRAQQARMPASAGNP